MKNSTFLLSALATVAALYCSPAQTPDSGAKPGAKTTITHVDAVQADKLVTEKKVVVLDIRTPREFAAGHIAGATNIDFYAGDFEKRLGSLGRDKTYLVHCASGGRSTKSLESFKKLGFASVIHLDGGFKAWEKAGKAVETKGSQ